jgi:uncharacterized Fe-S cluster-containing radical SAM superfamily protein
VALEPFDPFVRASEVENIVMEGSRRKYYRFRYSRHYGGIVTADAVGCNILCAYCWNYFRNQDPKKVGTYYFPAEVADRLLKIARKKGVKLFRVSGAEPVLGRKSMEHLIDVVKCVDSPFILETNGLLLGYMPELADMLEGLDITVRVAIKGWNEKSFERITGADGSAFRYQLIALKELTQRDITVWPAIMIDVFGDEGARQIKERVAEIGLEVEMEELNRYPFVMDNLKKRGIEVKTS